jgi:hypothetical protein
MPTRTSEVLDVKMAAELLTVSHPIRSMISSSVESFPAGKSVENGSPPGMRCCAGSRAPRKTIYSSGPSNAVIGMSSPPPSNPARCSSRIPKISPSCFLYPFSAGVYHLYLAVFHFELDRRSYSAGNDVERCKIIFQLLREKRYSLFPVPVFVV